MSCGREGRTGASDCEQGRRVATLWNRKDREGIPLDWGSFEAKVAEVDRETRRLKAVRDLHVSGPLYRGQADATWHLETTLDRRKPRMTLDKYLTIMEGIQPRIERLSGRSWSNLGEEISGLRQNGLESVRLFPTECANTETIISFMVYLRQHGFPSPLLDWTSDPYTAAFFAFSGIQKNAERVAIFIFRECTGSVGDAGTENEPTAMSFGPHILNTSPRHAKQQAQYTWCVERSTSGASLDCYAFADHEQAMNLPGFRIEAGACLDEERAENVVDKYTIPVSEQRSVLASLAQRNINKCSLFGRSADGLLEGLWTELILDDSAV